MILDISLAPIQVQLRGEVRRMGIATAILTVVLLGGVGLLVRRLVLARLIRLGRTARSIYFTGMAQAFLLDRFYPEWKPLVWEEQVFLEDLLSAALGE